MAGKRILFARTTGLGTELWITDGTTTGTYLVRDIQPGSGSASPGGLAGFNGGVVFAADDGVHGVEPWISDGTAAGTVLLADLAASGGSAPGGFAASGSRVVFAATTAAAGTETWISDGTASGTVLLKDIMAGAGGSAPGQFTALPNGGWVFTARTVAAGEELWVTDGKAAGTKLLVDIAPGPLDSEISAPTSFAGGVIFQADDGLHGAEPWVTDGTAAGTHLLVDLAPVGGSGATGFTLLGNKVLFWADNGTGAEPYITDGTAGGTRLLKSIFPNFGSVDIVFQTPAVVVLGGKAFFQADDGKNGPELWVTDGTSAGTVMLTDINKGMDGSDPVPLGVVNGWVLFSADDGTSKSTELWATDGTAAGTHLLKDINPFGASYPSDMVVADGFALFRAIDSDHGDSIWVTDGTAAGTWLLQAGTAGWLDASGHINAVGLDALIGTPDNDRLQGAGLLRGSGGDDLLIGSKGTDTLDGGTGVDVMVGGAGNDVYRADTSADRVLEAPGNGTDTVMAGIPGGGFALPENVEALVLLGPTLFGRGNAGDNSLIGSTSANWLLGGAGADTLDGGGGNDTLFGGEGADLFLIGHGASLIGDFTLGVDHIRLTGSTSLGTITERAGSAVIDLGNGDSLTLVHVAKAALGAGDILLG
ncbi:hypothetical protein JMJ55_24610 [Belnapia sp. T6]|uniref:ELWxxDGT repeat-containing protein n=1 Tax=Belnapia mucosa TaxID=2804532 RepID=A0ABS1VCR1_9PROT|nr:ELWxxDGT repeat protein [Belnapia mucosa]MBL6458524.1 hypothetical protein [Belnapia mucosa]